MGKNYTHNADNSSMKQRLKKAGYTREQVAERCGVAVPTVNNWLSAGRPIPPEKMRVLRAMLKSARGTSPLEQVLAFGVRLTAEEYERLQERAGIDQAHEVERIVRELLEERWGIISGKRPGKE